MLKILLCASCEYGNVMNIIFFVLMVGDVLLAQTSRGSFQST